MYTIPLSNIIRSTLQLECRNIDKKITYGHDNKYPEKKNIID